MKNSQDVMSGNIIDKRKTLQIAGRKMAISVLLSGRLFQIPGTVADG